ncbi:MAG: nitroreductase family protein [Treponemataceae bacterium]
MNIELLNLIKNRRRCRKFSSKKIEQNIIEKIIECARSAPTGMNFQTFSFVVINDSEKIAKLASAVRTALNRGSDYNMYNPALLILTTNKKESRFREVDNACAMQNIYLACEALDLGCVWINQIKDCHDDFAVREILTELGVPEDHGVYGSAAIGYKADDWSAKQKELISKVIFN